MAVLHRVPVNVINVPRQILIVLDGVFPISFLPDISFAFPAFMFQGHWQPACETGLQQSNARRKIVVTGRQAPNEMHVVRQDDRRNCFK